MAQGDLSRLPLVSVGVPTFNRPGGLRRTLECITAQSYRRLEIIVSDNGSPSDEPGNVVRAFAAGDSRVRFFRQPAPGTASENFRFVLQEASGEFFMWAADDDEWDPAFIERCVKGMDDPAVTTVMPRFRTLFREGGKTLEMAMPKLSPRRTTAQNVMAFLARPTPSLLYGLHRREALRFFLEEKRWFDFYDCYFVLRLLAQGRILILDESLYVAGVDASVYQVKAVAAGGWPRLSYLPFLRAATAMLSRVPLSLPERLMIRFRLVLMVCTWFVGHEVLRMKLR